MKSNKNLQVKRLKLLKTKTPSSLYSLINDFKEDKKKNNLIPLSKLLKTKLQKKEDNKEISFSKDINSKNINRPYNFPISLKNSSSLLKYKSLSYKIIPSKYPKIKLPKIKSFDEKSSEKESKIDLILNKFDEYDDKFKKQSKFSIDAGELEYMQYKLNKGLNKRFNYDHIGIRFNYKKIYSKLFKRIKKLKAI